MATKTGADLQASLLGDASELEGATAYTMDVVDIAVRVKFDYTIASPPQGDDGTRQIGRVVRLTPAEMAAGLTSAQRQAVQDLVASKI